MSEELEDIIDQQNQMEHQTQIKDNIWLKWRIKKVFKEFTGHGNIQRSTGEIMDIYNGKSDLPRCPMMKRNHIDYVACEPVIDGERDCKDCYKDVVVG